MMVCQNSYDFAFYHMNKCGGTSIRKILARLDRHFKQVGKGHEPLGKKKKLNKYKHVYVNIRNPFHRIVSMYEFEKQILSIPAAGNKLYKHGIPIDFNDYLYNFWLSNENKIPEFFTQQDLLFVEGKLPENVQLIKLEEVDQHWPSIISRHFDTNITMVPRMNTTMHGNPMEYFDDEMYEAVKNKEHWVAKLYNL
jgi:hypothetical protein